jgi:hypothetical protein
MNLFRMGHDAYGHVLTDGLSWDLLAVAFWAAVVVIVGHLIVRAFTSGKRRKGEG